MIVDDDHAVRDSPEFRLELAGYSVATYGSAVSFLARCPARPACMIFDQHVPEMTGRELAARLRADDLRIPVLLMTSTPRRK